MAYFTQMCSAVAYCHEQNVIHRDLKLENIVLTNTPEGQPACPTTLAACSRGSSRSSVHCPRRPQYAG